MKYKSFYPQQGVAMMELLIALIIVAIGVLGLVAMQSTALQNGNNAQLRYQATLMAYDMVERMRANPLGVAANHYSAITLSTTATAPTSPFTAANVYQLDVAEWKTDLATLPNGNGSITEDNLVDGRFTIHVRWSQLEGAGTGGNTDSIDIVVRL